MLMDSKKHQSLSGEPAKVSKKVSSWLQAEPSRYSIAPRGGPITQSDAQYPPYPAPMNAASLQGTLGKRVMKTVLLGAVVAITATLAHAEDLAEMISRYRHAHGLSTVKTDPQLTAIAERQAKAMAASGMMDHSMAGSFTARMSGVRTGMAAENIAAGTKTWAETFRMWQTSAAHNANCRPSALVGQNELIA